MSRPSRRCLLQVASLRAASEPAVVGARAAATATLLAELAAAGVDTSGSLEDVAVRIETEPSLASHRGAMRRHLLADQALVETLLGPLRDLYGV